MASVTQLGYLGLSVSDRDQWEQSAAHVLGLQPNGRDPDDWLFLRMDEYHHRFIVHPAGKNDLAYVGWEVATEAALEAMAERLRQAGVAVTTGTSEEAEGPARRRINQVRRSQRYPIRGVGPLAMFDEPFHSPRPISGFKTGELGLGHFVVWVERALLPRAVGYARQRFCEDFAGSKH
jgi:catechol 2,3-dioxygenase-like lactoylglutathione lyase family enzyme